MLATAASRAATNLGLGHHGVRAHTAFKASAFELYASEAIDEMSVDIEVAPLDICAGVLPITQLALHLWFKNHRPTW